MRILVTNDDGIDSEGLHVLARRLAPLGAVMVFAPSGEYSGAGASIGHLGPGLPDIHRVRRPDLEDVEAVYHLDGPPALATLLACKGLFGQPPELVVSGINPGWNVGHAVHFSGTVGAGITADLFGLPAVAVSQQAGSRQCWETAAEVVADLVPKVMEQPRLLNVNVPNLEHGRLAGLLQTKLSDRIPYGLHSPTLVETESGRHTATFERHGPYEDHEGTDTWAVTAGYVSVTELTSTRGTPDSARLDG